MTALVVYLQNTIARLRERQEGQTMAEYALILGGIAVVVIAGILILGPRSPTSSSRPAARSRPSRARSSICIDRPRGRRSRRPTLVALIAGPLSHGLLLRVARTSLRAVGARRGGVASHARLYVALRVARSSDD